MAAVELKKGDSRGTSGESQAVKLSNCRVLVCKMCIISKNFVMSSMVHVFLMGSYVICVCASFTKRFDSVYVQVFCIPFVHEYHVLMFSVVLCFTMRIKLATSVHTTRNALLSRP